ncbi:hypothetical protein HPP92_015940 [Vanilla planifolia]|uniref:DUF7032 domain-containing protein n=1 Tax=Vanilla planifolia TaxID=51239 RepID=A0A835QF80_VANPL|nr:hypothetical protein HPP92_015940 [Vanilla planifolia]
MRNEVLLSIEQHIDCLISSTCSIKTFCFKWQVIREKLRRLNSDLKSSVHNSRSCKNSLLEELLQDLLKAVSEIKMLADHCFNGSYSGGKLLMRSDIDKASSRLDILSKRFSEAHASGTVTYSEAIVVAKPAAGASQDDMRFYMNDLFLRLRIGNLDMKVTALEAINDILNGDDKHLVALLLDVEDDISLLVSLLSYSDVGIQERASEAVMFIAGFDSCKAALIAAGAIDPLVRILEAGSTLAKVKAAWTLKNLTENSDNVWSLSANGGVTALLKLTRDAQSNAELIYPCCGVLQNLGVVTEIKRFMIDEGMVSILFELLTSKDEATRIQAIELLTTIASGEDIIKAEIVRAGATEKLLKFLNPNITHSLKEKEVAFKAIDLIFFSASNSLYCLLGSRFLGWVLFFLNTGEDSIQEVVLKAMLLLCEASEEAMKAMGDAGFMSLLVKLLEVKSSKVSEMAAQLLVKLVSVQKNRKKFIDEEQNVKQILELLCPGDDDVKEARRFLLPLLTSLTNSNSGRKKIATSGYLKKLEKLAESDVIDAKKIVRKISGNRFRSMLNGIWSF